MAHVVRQPRRHEPVVDRLEQRLARVGFVLHGARPVPFVRALGNVRLFTVEIEEVPPGPPPEVSRRLERLARTLGKRKE